MTLLLTVPVPDDAPVDAFLADVAAGARRVLSDLGLPTDGLAVEAGPGLTASGLPMATTPGTPAWGLADPAQQVVADLTAHRGLLVCAAGLDPDAAVVEGLVRVLCASLGVRDLAPRDGTGSGEEWLARSLAASDARPLRITLSPADAERLPDGLAGADLGVRQLLYGNLGLALPPALAVDEAARAGTMTAWVRDVRFPSWAIGDPAADLVQQAMGYWATIAVTNLPALVTPAALDAAMVLTSLRGLWTTRLAEQRWDPAALTDLLRFRLRSFDTGPADLPMLVEAMATSEIPAPEDDDELAEPLVREFPGIAATFLAGPPDEMRGIDRLHQILDAARSARMA